MKKHFILFLILIGYIHLVGAQSCNYKDKLEPKSKLIFCAANHTYEECTDGRYIEKTYYPENKTITNLVTFSSFERTEKHGLYEKRWDDGTLIISGHYHRNVKNGKWQEEFRYIGDYVNDEMQGIWNVYNKDSAITATYNYLNNKLHGKSFIYDSLGKITKTFIYEHGKLLNSDSIPEPKNIIRARFPGCEELGLDVIATKACAEKKLLEFINLNIKYPKKARNLGIEGKTLTRFTIDVDGYIVDIKVLNGISEDIKEEVLRIIKKMPKWIPGTKNDKRVNMYFNMPINFTLK